VTVPACISAGEVSTAAVVILRFLPAVVVDGPVAVAPDEATAPESVVDGFMISSEAAEVTVVVLLTAGGCDDCAKVEEAGIDCETAPLRPLAVFVVKAEGVVETMESGLIERFLEGDCDDLNTFKRKRKEEPS
jgi:hypothetical protein